MRRLTTNQNFAPNLWRVSEAKQFFKNPPQVVFRDICLTGGGLGVEGSENFNAIRAGLDLTLLQKMHSNTTYIIKTHKMIIYKNL